MARQQLETAAQTLRTASDATTGDHSDRLGDLADQLDDLATRDAGPDHGRLARIQSALVDLQEELSAETSDAIDDADDAINAYRETIEGGV